MERIPRRLRVKKLPTFELFDESLKKTWTDTLSACSFALIDIIITSKKREMEVLQQEILDLQQALKLLQSATQFEDFDSCLNEKLNRLEKEIISRKKKFRDKIDYDTKNVYVWKLRRQWSGISQPAGGTIKHVSFSDTENEFWDNTMAASDLDQSFA